MTGKVEVSVQDARNVDVDRLASIWFDGWQDAHAAILPPKLRQARTFESFQTRLGQALRRVRCAVQGDRPIGFAMLKDDELYQFYVSAEARGTGVAVALMNDSLRHLEDRGVTNAWLACAIGNDRAARFYEKCGWRRTGTMTSKLDVEGGLFLLDVWRYEIVIRR